MEIITSYETKLRKQIYSTITRRQARLQLHKMGLLKAVEENLIEYYQYFTTETNQEKLTKKANQILIQLHNNYLNETGWIWQKYQRNVVVLKDMTE